MANLKSSRKDIRRIFKRNLRNCAAKSCLKTLAKRVVEARSSGNLAEEKSAAISYISAMDKAVKRGIIHRNRACRVKSALSPLVFS